jgi:hypothetical protein
MDLVDIGIEPSYRHELMAAFSFPLAMFVLALIPGDIRRERSAQPSRGIDLA